MAQPQDRWTSHPITDRLRPLRPWNQSSSRLLLEGLQSGLRRPGVSRGWRRLPQRSRPDLLLSVASGPARASCCRIGQGHRPRPRPPRSPPGRFDAAPEDRLDREATRHVEDARPGKPRTSYAADWNAWLRFCAEAGLPPAAPAPWWRSSSSAGTSRRGGRDPAGRLTAPNTIERRLSGVSVAAGRQLNL